MLAIVLDRLAGAACYSYTRLTNPKRLLAIILDRGPTAPPPPTTCMKLQSFPRQAIREEFPQEKQIPGCQGKRQDSRKKSYQLSAVGYQPATRQADRPAPGKANRMQGIPADSAARQLPGGNPAKRQPMAA